MLMQRNSNYPKHAGNLTARKVNEEHEQHQRESWPVAAAA
jgi:hypothetical protein